MKLKVKDLIACSKDIEYIISSTEGKVLGHVTFDKSGEFIPDRTYLSPWEINARVLEISHNNDKTVEIIVK